VKRLALPQIAAPFAKPQVAKLALDAAIVCLLFWTTSAVFRGSTGHIQNCDSTYSLVVSEKLLGDGTVNLRDCIPDDPVARQTMQGYAGGHDLPYQMVRFSDPRAPGERPAVYYGYPLGSSILSIPLVYYYGPMRGLSTLHPDGRPNLAIENLLQLRIAARISAAIVVLFYLIARFFCSPLVSLLIAAGFAFGSPVWSTLSRALWSHTWMVFCLSVAILLVLVRRRMQATSWKQELLLGTALGTALFWVLLVRAHGIFSAAAIGCYLALHHRRLLFSTLAIGGIWTAAFVAISLHCFGTLTPPSVYSAGTIDGHDVLNRFAWLMVSPSRGLLIYCPYLIVVPGVLIAFRRHVADAELYLPIFLAIAGHTALFACYNGWHAGSSYGPRYFTDLLPWFVLATALAAQALANARTATPSWRIRAAVVLLATTFVWGCFVHYRGANSAKAWFWNARAIAVGQDQAAKEWQHPQFLAGLTFEVSLEDGSVTPRD
jgi:hypothetical protein